MLDPLFLTKTILLISIFANLFLLGVINYFKGSQRLLKINLNLYILGILGWSAGIFLNLYFESLIIERFIFAFPTIVMGAHFLFAQIFPLNTFPKSWQNYLSLLPPIILFGASFVPGALFNTIQISSEGYTILDQGYLSLSYGLFVLFYSAFPIFLLYNKFKNEKNILIRNQLRYLVFGYTLFLIFAVFSNLILPNVFKIYFFNGIGPAFSILLVAFIVYCIRFYSLLGIDLIIRLGMVYGLLFATVTFFYTYLASFTGELISGPLVYIIPSILITFGFLPLKNIIETLTDRIFFRKTYSVQTIINELNKIIHISGLDLDQLLEKFNQIIVEFIRVEHASILLLTPQGEFISRHAFAGNKKIILGRNHLIVEHIYKYPDKLIDKERMGDEIHQEITEELKRLHTSLVIPIEVKGQVIGLYLMSEKKSQDPFTDEEIDLLRLIATESGSSIDNARLFEELKKIDEVKSKFISIISHQLRTPLTSIRWNLELLLQEDFDKKTKDELFEHSYQGALNMAKNLDELFTALDIEEKGIIPKIKVEQANFHELLKEALKEIDREAKEKKLNIDISFPDELPVLALDKDRVSRILAILLKNAVAYSNPDHEINVVGMIEIKNNTKYFICSVRDQGIGLTPDDEKGIFTRFYRGEEAKKHSPNGSGLGLFVAKYLVNLHRGEIWYTSHGPNRGATFSFSLPIA